MKEKQSLKSIFVDGILKNNPVFMLFLGMCPVLATTSSFSNALGMGLAVVVILTLTNIIISLIRNIVPKDIRIPVYIVIIATVVTIVEMLMNAYMPDIAMRLGVYLSIVVVNCIILGRAEAFASQNNVGRSVLDGLGTGIGFLGGLLILALFREIIGTGALTYVGLVSGETLFTLRIFPEKYAISIFVNNAGAFIMLGLLVAAVNAIVMGAKKSQAKKAAQKELAAKKQTVEEAK
ncbi:MAG: electron transport complex subunit RsxE [Bacilli bacterium]|jgi:electron transport complex protein RnfE